MPHRARSRLAASRGFTLLELMVVVMLVALLAVIATPSMAAARADRLTFDYARQASSMFHNGRARSAGRGAAHLVVFTTEAAFGARGAVMMFEALDGSPAPGPNPSASCRGNGQWTYVGGYEPGGAADGTRRARVVDGFSLNSTNTSAVVVKDDIKMQAFAYRRAGALDLTGDREAVNALVVCTTPKGITFVGTGATAAEAITAMMGSPVFTGALELEVARHRGGTAMGLTRRVILAGAAAPRIRSE